MTNLTKHNGSEFFALDHEQRHVQYTSPVYAFEYGAHTLILARPLKNNGTFDMHAWCTVEPRTGTLVTNGSYTSRKDELVYLKNSFSPEQFAKIMIRSAKYHKELN